jgi:hypothetical protein
LFDQIAVSAFRVRGPESSCQAVIGNEFFERRGLQVSDENDESIYASEPEAGASLTVSINRQRVAVGVVAGSVGGRLQADRIVDPF